MSQDIYGKDSLPLQVKKPSHLKMVGIFSFLLGLAVINYFIYNQDHERDEVVNNSENYQTPSPRTIQESKSLGHDQILKSDILQDEAKLKQQLAVAKAKMFIERLQAPQHTDNENAGSTSSNTTSNSSNSNQSLQTKLADPNKAFLVEASNSKTEHVYATHYGPLPYVIGQGKFIFGTLSTAINSDLPGQIAAIVSEDVYGEQGRKILIPKGSQLIGEYRSGLVNNQSRLFVVWTRLKEPNGVDIQIGSPGTDSLGQTGVTGVVDNHYAARYLGATLIALIGAGAANVGVHGSDEYNSMAAYRQSVSQALASQASDTLNQNINIPPTIHVPQGEKIIVYVNRDLDFSGVYK